MFSDIESTFGCWILLGADVGLDIEHEALILLLEVGLQDLERSFIYLVVGVHLEWLQLVTAALLLESQRKHVLSIHHKVLRSSL